MARLFTPSESKYYLMALDAGTGSIRAVIFDLEGNQVRPATGTNHLDGCERF